MDLRGEAASLSVQEAMKTLNMTKFTAEELNNKFQYRVQSITRGLGGSLEYQKSVYTAWEYLNRMLARESSNQTEEVLKKVDKTVTMLEKPKQLDMIPVRLNNTSKKASLIIQKETEPERRNRLRNLRARTVTSKNKASKPVEDEKRQDLEKSLGVSALPGQVLQKQIRWMDQDRSNSKLQNEDFEEKRAYQKEQLARQNNAPQKQPKKDPTASQLKEIVRMDRSERRNLEDKSAAEKRQELGRLLGKLPKLPRNRSQSQAVLFKRTAALNEIFEIPRKPSKHDQRSLARRAAWKEKANQILSDRPDSAKKQKTSAQVKLRKATRRSVSKQPVEHMLYKKADMDLADKTTASEITMDNSDDKYVTVTRPKTSSRPRDTESGGPKSPAPESTAPGSKLPGRRTPGSRSSRSKIPRNNVNLLTHGPFTPSRIMNWIKSTQEEEIRVPDSLRLS